MKYFLISSVISVIIGILDLRFDPDNWTYCWLISGVLYGIIAFIISFKYRVK